MRLLLTILPLLALSSGATAADLGVLAPIAPPRPPPVEVVAPPPAPEPEPAEIDVIDDALWAKFAGDNGPHWWLKPKVIRDRSGHSQLDNAKFIVERFRAHHLPDALALAVVVNALMESSLLADRVHPVSKAAGLFQCWRNPRQSHNLPGGGAGNGTPGFDWGSGDGLDATPEQMLDRDKNLERIVFELRHVRNTTGKEFFGVPPGELFGGHILERAEQGASVAELAALWGERIERYRPNPGGSYAFRGKIAWQLFGDLAYQDTSSWRKNHPPPTAPCAPPAPEAGLALEDRVDAPLPSGWHAMTPWREAEARISLWPVFDAADAGILPCS